MQKIMELKTPEDYQAAMKLQALDARIGLLQEKRENLLPVLRKIAENAQRLLQEQISVVQKHWGEELMPSSINAEKGTVTLVPVPGRKSPGNAGSTTPLEKGKKNGKKKDSHATSEGSTK